MTGTLTTFRVSFWVRDCYYIDVSARDGGEACTLAQELYEQHGTDPQHGFGFDISDGGHGGYSAEEVAS